MKMSSEDWVDYLINATSNSVSKKDSPKFGSFLADIFFANSYKALFTYRTNYKQMYAGAFAGS
jgi:hypothetical protein